MKGPHRAPMKKDAERRGAEEEPTSSTLGTESGRGVVSRRTVWLNLEDGLLVGRWRRGGLQLYRALRAAILDHQLGDETLVGGGELEF